MGFIDGFLNRYLVAPMRDATGYNLLTTALIAVLLVLAFIIAMRTVRKTGGKGLLLDLLPYIFLGASMRSLEDACFYPCSWPLKLVFITPGIWMVSFFAFLGALRFLGAGRRTRLFGWALAIPNLLMAASRITNFRGLMLIFGFSALGCALAFGAKRLLRIRWPAADSLVLAAHVFDGSSTLVAVRFFGYFEEHVFGRWLIAAAGPGTFYAVKIAGIFLLLLAVERMGLEKGERAAMLAAMLAVGLGPGLRNTLSLAMGV